MKRAVSVSLGNPARDKKVVVDFNGQPISIERIGSGGDAQKARSLFAGLDGKVDALSVGGIDLYVRVGQRDYPVRAALELVQDVHLTPLVDGRALKYVLERRLFERAAPLWGEIPRFRRAFIPSCIDRLGLAEAVSAVADEVYMGDLMFYLKIPYAVRGLKSFRRIVQILMPVMGFLPLDMLFPPGSREDRYTPRYEKQWQAADLIAGDLHYIRKYSPPDLSGKIVITNTTTDENLEMLRQRGVKKVITTTPRYEGRSFGVNLMEAVLTAYAGKGRPLNDAELDRLIDELELRPAIQELT